MQILTPYIPKEYLALRINYCRQQLDALPEVTLSQRTVRGTRQTFLLKDSHIYSISSKNNSELKEILRQREEASKTLSKLEGLWFSTYKGLPPEDIAPRKITRYLQTGYGGQIAIDSKFFSSLKHDSNPYYPEHKTYYYNGTYYRSAAEADIARFYTEQDIPFKYEPEIWLNGMHHAIYTDFVILIKELDLCKFHEHFGLKKSADYTRKTATTYNNYSGAGLLPELDVFYTYDVDDVPFDIRSLDTKLNSVVYNSLFAL